MADHLIRILVVGGYGGFGGRLTRHLVRAGHEVLVLGRSEKKARRFCESFRGTTPVAGDRNSIAALLDLHRPDLVIDAAGPFQGSDYRLPKDCIDRRIAYLDLADARDFVGSIDLLNEDALRSGVPVISGASSVPALSGAVARHLSAHMDIVSEVEISIGASSRGTGGRSVIAAILSYVGKPIPIRRGGCWTTAFGWDELRRAGFAIPGRPPLRGRWVALVDVPDHVLLPGLLPGEPGVSVRAGTDLAHQTIGLWVLGKVMRFFRLQSARPLVWGLAWFQKVGRGLGSRRSAMTVEIKGFEGRAPIKRTWTLIAEHGDGPEIPALAAVILANRIAKSTLPSGARSAAGLLTLDEFEPLFCNLHVTHRTSELCLPEPLYARIMGAAFTALPSAIRRMHSVCGGLGAQGQATVQRGTNPIANLVAWVMRFPPTGNYNLHVEFVERGGVETWTRNFDGYRFKSRLCQRNSRLVERFGPLRFHFDLPSNSNGLSMQLRRWSFLGIPLPLILGPRGEAREWEENGQFRFNVPISLPVIGLIVHYQGVLDPPSTR